MGSEWKDFYLEDLASFKYGKFLAKSQLNETGFPVFSGYGIVGYLPTYQFAEPQLLIVCRGEGGTGDVKMSPPECSITNLSIVVSPDEKVVSKNFLYWALKASDTHRLRTGSAQAQIVIGSLEKLSISIPIDRSQQSEIARILDNINDRITLLRETNATLEAMAQALFKSWFVDFDPVHAKKVGRTPEGMDEATANLFPDDFEESELGLVPKGWGVGKIGDVSTVKGGFAYKGESFSDEGLPVIKIKNIVGDGTVNLRDVQYINSELAEKTQKFALQDSDIVIAMTGATIGKTGVVVTYESKAYLNQRVAKFEDNSAGENNKWFVYVAFQNKLISDQVVNSASGSAQPNISTAGIESVRLIIPKETKLLSVFNELVSPLFNNWISNHKQAQTLANLRDTLLPRLISGQLRIADADPQLNKETNS